MKPVKPNETEETCCVCLELTTPCSLVLLPCHKTACKVILCRHCYLTMQSLCYIEDNIYSLKCPLCRTPCTAAFVYPSTSRQSTAKTVFALFAFIALSIILVIISPPTTPMSMLL